MLGDVKLDKITVIVPVYNEEKYLEQCLDSIINQTYKNLEIILVDDGSTDSSLEICKKYKKIDKRIKVIHKENGGLSSARNAGLDAAHGKFIMFCDSDDYYVPKSCEILLKEINKKKADYVVGNYIHCREDGTWWDKPIFDQEQYKNFKININDHEKSFYIMSSSVCNKMFRRSFLRKHQLRFVEGIPAEDAIFTMYCFMKAERTYYVKDIMYAYRQRNSGSSISTNNNLNYFKGISKAYKINYLNFKENNELGFYRYFYLKTLFYIVYKFIDSTVMNEDEQELALEELQWFTKLSRKLNIKYRNEEFFDIIKLINKGNFRKAIERCAKIREIRSKMSEEDKLKMSKIPPKEYHKYIINEGLYGKKKNSFDSGYEKLGIRYRGQDITTELGEVL